MSKFFNLLAFKILNLYDTVKIVINTVPDVNIHDNRFNFSESNEEQGASDHEREGCLKIEKDHTVSGRLKFSLNMINRDTGINGTYQL